MSLIRKVRAVVVMGVVWAVAWLPIGLAYTVIAAIRVGAWLPGQAYLRGLGVTALAGGVSGMAFGTLLAIVERRRSVTQLSPGRFALLGLVASVTPLGLLLAIIALRFGIPLALIGPAILVRLTVTSLIGAACASTVLYVARRAPALPSGDRPLIGSD